VRTAAALAALLLASCNAQTATAPSISVDNAWARATLPGQTSSAAYFVIANAGGADA
jgi:copper(I)-binding protein